VVDIQCDSDDGTLYVYYANIIVHDGHIAKVQWDVDQPRAVTNNEPYNPPTDPEELPYNQDYQSAVLYSPGELSPVGDTCDDTCSTAMALVGTPCTNICPDCADVHPDYEDDEELTADGATKKEAIEAVWESAVDLLPKPAVWCYAEQNTDTGVWTAHMMLCKES